MDYQELPGFVKELRQRQDRGTGLLALEFTILTCVRTSEALGATWAEIDFEKKLWTIPAARMKAGKEHTVPLSDRAMEILKRQKDNSCCEYVFTGKRRTKMADRAMWNMLFRVKTSITVHGFRASFRDWAGDMTTFQREIIEECLAHQIGNDVERAYRRQTALKKRQEIMQAWSAFCAGEVQP
jgi:integrase